MAVHTVIKTIRIPRSLHARLIRRAQAERKDFSATLREAALRGLRPDDGIDMPGALGGVIGKYEGTGESQGERMKRYGSPRPR
jgi:hypothetical protein